MRDPAAPQANEWVVLVALSKDRQHRFYVMPRDVVVATVQALNLAYKNPSRVMLNENEFKDYADEWDLMQRPSWEAQARAGGLSVEPCPAPFRAAPAMTIESNSSILAAGRQQDWA